MSFPRTRRCLPRRSLVGLSGSERSFFWRAGRAIGFAAGQFTLNVVRESLRLYPPVWALPRQSVTADELGGYRIPRRTMVTMSPWIVHRHPEFWDEPERFDPDRFLPERSRDRPRHAYFPFGAGGRSCVGEDFALLEATLVLAMTLRRFDVQVVAEHLVEPDPILTLRPRNGTRVRMTERDRGRRDRTTGGAAARIAPPSPT